MDLGSVWDLCDTFNGMMAIPNLAAVFFLSGEVLSELRQYLDAEKQVRIARNGSAREAEKKYSFFSTKVIK